MTLVLLPYVLAILSLTIRTTFMGQMPDNRVLLVAGIVAITLSPSIIYLGWSVHPMIWWSFLSLLVINILHFVLVSSKHSLYNAIDMTEHRRPHRETKKSRSKTRNDIQQINSPN